jgi:hypothetical protein
MHDRTNGVVEDLCFLIGYTATCSLVDWFGGGNVFIPNQIDHSHPLCKVLGVSAFVRLFNYYDGKKGNDRILWVPTGYQREIDRRDRMIAGLYSCGLTTSQIASIACMSKRHVQSVKHRIDQLGLMDLVVRNRVDRPVVQKSDNKSVVVSGSRKKRVDC